MDGVLVIVPAWNEASAIEETIHGIARVDGSLHILVVDDGSTDETASLARAAGATVLQLPFNLGVGGAMRAGFVYAHRHGFARAIQVDADGQHDPADIARVLSGLDHADVSIGARFASMGDYAVRGPRRIAMRALAMALSHLARTQLTDVTSGFRAANARAIAQYTRYYPTEYLGDTVDSLVAALHSGLSVTQVAVRMKPRRAGKPSKGPVGSTLYLIRAVFALVLALVGRSVLRRATARPVR